MRSKKIIGLILAASMKLCGCSADEKIPVSSVVNTTETTTETTRKQIEFNPHVYSV